MNELINSQTESCRRLLAQILDPLDTAVVCLDSDGMCSFSNRAFSSMFGYQPDETLTGKSLPAILDFGGSCSGPAEACKILATIARGEEYHNSDELLQRADGSMLRVACRGRLLCLDAGGTTAVLLTFTDISATKTLEEQLRQAQKMEAVGTLAGGVAHDFNNILTAIIGFGSLMEMKMAADDPLMRSLQQILAAADRASELTRSLLAFSRKQLTDMRPDNLNRVVQGIEKMMKRLLREDIELSLSLCAGDLPVMADAGQLEQVLLNLATNSRDALPRGGEIKVATAHAVIDADTAQRLGLPTGGSYAELSFHDNGCGMDAATAARIFDPLFTTKSDGEGTGLGLPVCYGIIRKHGGNIQCCSEKGGGTLFSIYLPEIDLCHQDSDKGAAGLDHLQGDATILLAEDDQGVSTLNSRMFEQFGYRVITAADGAEAVSLYNANRNEIGLCILDVIMPKMSGVDAYHGIRTINPAAKIIFISGYSEDFLKKQDLPAGARIVRKPLRLATFLETVKKELQAA